jgi:hypothetical protein
MNSSNSPDLDALVQLFYDRPDDELGAFQEVPASELPQLERILLDHDQHMTLTIESHHASPVDLRVLEVHTTETHYARKILLSRRSDGRTVQFGIVRLANNESIGSAWPNFDPTRRAQKCEAPFFVEDNSWCRVGSIFSSGTGVKLLWAYCIDLLQWASGG